MTVCPIIPTYIENAVLNYYQKNADSEENVTSLQLQRKSIAFLKQEQKMHVRKSGVRSTSINAQRLEAITSSFGGSISSLQSPPPLPRKVWDTIQVIPPLAQVNHNDAAFCDQCMGKVDSFFRTVFSISPLKIVNNQPPPCMKAYIHDPHIFNNACWIPGLDSVFFGDVDRRVYNPMVGNLGITAHEFGHAVIDDYSRGGLLYLDQSGALNESIADVFGIMTKHFCQNQTNADQSDVDWSMGEGIIVDPNGADSFPLRSMKAPGTAFKNHPIFGDDPQPGCMQDYKDLPLDEDDGGVHINSGIPNRAFYLTASGLGGPSWDKAGKVWFQALRQADGDNFLTFAQRTVDVAKHTLRMSAPEIDIIRRAWTTVGVFNEGSMFTYLFGAAAAAAIIGSTIISSKLKT